MKVKIISSPKFAQGGDLTPEKAKTILQDGQIRGKNITAKQQRYFGFLASKAQNGTSMDPQAQDQLQSQPQSANYLPFNMRYKKPMANGGQPEPTTQQGLSVENGQYQPISDDSILLTGDRHSDGGQLISNGQGNTVEAEGTEVVQNLPDEQGNDQMIVLGNLTVPNTNKKFKSVAKDLNEKQEKAQEYADKGTNLVLDNDPNDKWGMLAYNAGKVMLEGGKQKVDELKESKQTLADTQQAILDLAEENGLDPEDLSKGKITADENNEVTKKAQNGTNLSIAQRNNNPGNMKYAPWMKAYGAVQGTDKTENDGTFYATFPSVEEGQAAMKHLLFDKYSPNTTVANAINTWTFNKPYDTSLYGNIADKKLGDLTAKEQNELLNAITQGEDSKAYNWAGVTPQPTTTQASQPKPDLSYTDAQKVTPPQQTNTTPAPQASTSTAQNTQPTMSFDQYLKSQRTPNQLPSNVAPLNPLQILPEVTALKNNVVAPVFQQNYNPQLYQPYQVSFQDRINEDNRQLNALKQNPYFANNPQALSTIAGQTYSANNQALADQFRTNQSIANDVTNKNISLINEANMKNLQLQDIAYQRQSQALSNTKAENNLLINSIVNKVMQNNLENKQLAALEPLTNYRYDENGNLVDMRGIPISDYINFVNSQYTMPPPTTGKQSTNTNTTTTQTNYDKNGQKKGTTTTTKSSN